MWSDADPVHMPYCSDPKHLERSDWDCVVERNLMDGGDVQVEVTLGGIPCDHNSIELSGQLVLVEDLDWLIATLQELRPMAFGRSGRGRLRRPRGYRPQQRRRGRRR